MDSNLSRSRIGFFLCLVVIALFAGSAYCENEEIDKYPTKPITFITPVPAGTTTDLALRLLLKESEPFLGKPIVIVNRPGGGQAIGMAAIASAKPDGYTIGQSGASGLILNPHIEKVPYHPIRDFVQIMQCGGFNFGVIVKADAPFKSFQDILAYAKTNPKKVTYGCAKNSIHNLMIEQIARKEKAEFTHIPFKGASEWQPAVLGGHITMGVADFNHSLVEAGQIRILLLLREERSLEYPQTPTLVDLGYTDIPAPYYLGICGPKGMPDKIVRKLEDALTKAMKEPRYVQGMKDLRLPVLYRNSKELGDYVARNYEVFGKIWASYAK